MARLLGLTLLLSLAAVVRSSAAVSWLPWGPAAFEQARRDGKPIFLFIGFPTCHWCHVMSRESFENPEIASLLERAFVPVKVDREERPDLDRVYSAAARAAGWGGGWPLNLWLTPDLKPFFGANYLPPESTGGQVGLRPRLLQIEALWRERRADAHADADALAAALAADQAAAPTPQKDPGGGALAAYKSGYDAVHGGFFGAPKFPRPGALNWLLRRARGGDAEALKMSVASLRAMADGGIFDRLGGGFHRYAIDERWRTPHFEKLLGDNARLAGVYLQAGMISGDPELFKTARSTLDYLLRDLARPDGSFASGEDSESAGSDGAFYRWSADSVRAAAGPGVAEALILHFDVTASSAALYAALKPAETAARLGLPLERTLADLETGLLRLSQERARRPRPRRDEKVLPSWNGLAISVLARAGAALNEPRYLHAAERAAEALKAGPYSPRFCEDYAFLAGGLLDLYEATLDGRWLAWADELTQTQLNLFLDSSSGAFFVSSTQERAGSFLRALDIEDGSLPSATAASALNLLRLHRLLGRTRHRTAADQAVAALGRFATRDPREYPDALAAIDAARAKPLKLTIHGERAAADTKALLRAAHARFFPDLTIHGVARAGKASAVVCSGTYCALPAASPAALARAFDSITSFNTSRKENAR